MARGDDIGGAEVQTAAELEDQTVVFTGRLSEVTRSEVTELVEAHGARVTHNISNQSDLLVVGDNPGDEKLTFFANHDIPSLTEVEFYALFPDRFGHVDGVASAAGNGSAENGAGDESAGESTDEEAAAADADDEAPTETVGIEIDPVVRQLATIEAKRTDRGLDSVVAESTQGLLKEVIDGAELDADAEADPDEAEPLEVALPENVHAMVETAVRTTEGVESVGEFVAEACRVDFGFDFAEKQELSLGLPRGAVTALKQLADDEERCVEVLARDLLCDALEDALTADSA
ncbi:BRCT domain-containing protein [Halorussus lipolyticus]|uniref:BRCT domain-containing protein n=1 Tax=Halorussus lipolyticus TaxID=3034024 RepID=UPI0023E8D7B1|nr:BRCT domain-containing protein [Halorussus sp. DT80]